MDNLIVLFIDDEVEFLETLMKRMNKRGVKAMGAASGEEGLKHLGQHPVDVVVLDVKMPGLDGIQTLQEIKKIKPLVEVIMLTGHASLETASEGMTMGAFDYLMKPIDIDELLYKIQDACKVKRILEDKIKSIKRVISENE
ncbi:MAG: response regulator [Deltaproteobacteria bacterium]|nr:response regulator [Deltaproteobacteria bacterium]